MASSVGASGKFIAGEKAVTTSGTEVALAATGTYSSVVIIAKAANTNQIYVGGSDVTTSTNDGLDAGDSLTIAPRGGGIVLSDIYIDADTDGEGVDFYAVA